MAPPRRDGDKYKRRNEVDRRAPVGDSLASTGTPAPATTGPGPPPYLPGMWVRVPDGSNPSPAGDSVRPQAPWLAPTPWTALGSPHQEPDAFTPPWNTAHDTRVNADPDRYSSNTSTSASILPRFHQQPAGTVPEPTSDGPRYDQWAISHALMLTRQPKTAEKKALLISEFSRILF